MSRAMSEILAEAVAKMADSHPGSKVTLFLSQVTIELCLDFGYGNHVRRDIVGTYNAESFRNEIAADIRKHWGLE